MQGVRQLQEMVASDYARIGSEFQITAVKGKWLVVFGIRSIVCYINVLCDNGTVSSIQGKANLLEQRQCLFASEDVIAKFNSKSSCIQTPIGTVTKHKSRTVCSEHCLQAASAPAREPRSSRHL